MSFSVLVLRNLFRQRVRTLLTVLGISIGITTVVALGAITSGLKSSMGELVHGGGADFMVAQAGASDLTFSAVGEEDVAAIAARADVARATGVLIEVADVGSNPYFMIFGYAPDELPGEQLALLSGRLLDAPQEVLLGADAAAALGVSTGDRVELERETFDVVGVYRAGDRLRDSGAVAPLATVQRLASKQDVVTGVFVLARAGADAEAVAAGIERALPHLAAIATVEDYAEVDQGVEIMDALTLAISVLAVGIGAIGVMNTMIMSVFERTRELGVLRAIGWRGSRILRLIGSEALFLCGLAAVAGTLVGVAASRAVLLVPSVSAFLEPAYPLSIFVRALLVGVAVALAGAVYPALRAVRLSPLEALRYE
ncbi:MAG TPA: ABC transporter permease [Gaiellaceae bacterium]|nr:ABC transporter permease [Gaiellaceae bacterium]